MITAYRPDNVIDPEFESFAENVAQLGVLTGEDTSSWKGYLAAHRHRRNFSRSMEQHHLIMAIQLLELNVFLVLRPSGFLLGRWLVSVTLRRQMFSAVTC